MRTIDLAQASAPLADYVRIAKAEPLVVMDGEIPTAVIVGIEDTDLESLSLGTNADFLAIIERSRARARTEGAIPMAEVRRRLLGDSES